MSKFALPGNTGNPGNDAKAGNGKKWDVDIACPSEKWNKSKLPKGVFQCYCYAEPYKKMIKVNGVEKRVCNLPLSLNVDGEEYKNDYALYLDVDSMGKLRKQLEELNIPFLYEDERLRFDFADFMGKVFFAKVTENKRNPQYNKVDFLFNESNAPTEE